MTRLAEIAARPLDCAMNEPFAIAGGAADKVANALVRARLSDGTAGFGEGAPFAAFNKDNREKTLRAVRRAARDLVGRDATRLRPLLERVEELLAGRGAACAAVQMAVADAWTRRMRIPLRHLFGGAGTRLVSDVTITIVSAEAARAAAKRLKAWGIRTLKIKVGTSLEEDEARVRAAALPGLKIILDANQGYGARDALRLLARVKARGVRPILYEQPVAKDDWDGMACVERLGRIPVAADESVASRADAARLIRSRACSVVNIKLMKYGLLEAWDIALACRAAGLRLMIGGMVESPLAMACAAHLAAGIGGFEFIDLDTPLWFARNPMRGVNIKRGGVWDLSRVEAGVGVTPRFWA